MHLTAASIYVPANDCHSGDPPVAGRRNLLFAFAVAVSGVRASCVPLLLQGGESSPLCSRPLPRREADLRFILQTTVPLSFRLS